ncbi:MAG: hypothetical protein ACOH14_03370 [Rhodoglobus sp.]
MTPATVVIVAMASGMVVAGLYAVILVFNGTSSHPMLAVNIKYGMLFAVPTGAFVGLVAVSVGFGVRGLLHAGRRFSDGLIAVVAGLGVATTLIGSLLFLDALIGIAGFQLWPAIPCAIGAIGFTAWSRVRDRVNTPGDARVYPDP